MCESGHFLLDSTVVSQTSRRKPLEEEDKDKGLLLAFGNEKQKHASHQCCLWDSFRCSPADSRNAARATTPGARPVGTRRQRPAPRPAAGTGARPGPEEPSPGRPAGTQPRGALEAECRSRKSRWPCCNICVEMEREGDTSAHKVRTQLYL